MKRCHVTILLVAVVGAVAACGKDDKGDNKGGCKGGCGPKALKVTANLNGAAGLLVLDSNPSSAGLALAEQHNLTAARLGLADVPQFGLYGGPEFALAEGGSNQATDGGLKKVNSGGEVSSAISSEADENSGGQGLPAIRTIAVSKATREVYLHFERAFMYKNPKKAKGVDPWSMSSGYQCQIFRVRGGSIDILKGQAPSANNLECLDSTHFIDSWQAQRNSVFQFDDAGNLYYPGSIPEAGGKMVVYRRDYATGAITEMINSNIQVQDFLVTNGGGIFYTGTSGNNKGGGSGGFFRYVSAGGNLIEIARNWWNFIFEPLNVLGKDQAIFFGPDPRVATTASWNTAGLFKFDPEGGSSMADRTTPVLTPASDIWQWVNVDTATDRVDNPRWDNQNSRERYQWRAELRTRCEDSAGKVFIGGGSQISALRISSDDKTYIVGNVRKMRAGTFSCSLQVRGEHCQVEGVPYISAQYDTSAECTTAGGSWVARGNCNLSISGGSTGWRQASEISTPAACVALYNTSDSGGTVTKAEWNYDGYDYQSVDSPLCTVDNTAQPSNIWSVQMQRYVESGHADSIPSSKYQVNGAGCQQPSSNGGDAWTEELSAVARVETTTQELTLLSKSSEQAINVFPIGTEIFYSAFDTVAGRYQLRKAGADSSLSALVKDNFEVYQLGESPVAGSAFINGLDFSNNSYIFGSLSTSADGNGSFTIETKPGITGAVSTIVVFD
jgi:hypothetical protein